MAAFDSCDDIPVAYTELRTECWEDVGDAIGSGLAAESATEGYKEAAGEGAGIVTKVFLVLSLLGFVAVIATALALALRKRLAK